MAEITGNWLIEMTSPFGAEELTLRLKQNGTAVTGAAFDETGEYPLKDGHVEGRTVTGSFSVKKPLPLEIKFSVEIAGDTIEGTAKAGFLPAAPVTGRRI